MALAGEQGLAFWQNGKKPELQWDDIDTRESCANTIAPLGAPQDNEQACRIVFFNWHNCVNTKVQNQLGQVAGMRYVSRSGDVVLDRAAYGGITAFKSLPAAPG